MPHIIIEHSAELEADYSALCRDLHASLAVQDTVALDSIKTRSIAVHNTNVGGDDAANTMLHITLKLLPGRDDDLKKTMAQALFDVARQATPTETSLSVEVSELHAASYTK